jgi:hypothetical protein
VCQLSTRLAASWSPPRHYCRSAVNNLALELNHRNDCKGAIQVLQGVYRGYLGGL